METFMKLLETIQTFCLGTADIGASDGNWSVFYI